MTNNVATTPSFVMEIEDSAREGRLSLVFQGRLDSSSAAEAWENALEAVKKFQPHLLVIDASKLDYCDGTGIGLIYDLRRKQREKGRDFDLHDLNPSFENLFNLFDPTEFDQPEAPRAKKRNIAEELGRAASIVWNDLGSLIAFIGELVVNILFAILRPNQIRWKDAVRTAESSGVNALPIVLLISFLVGLIMAFQAAIPMRVFGATIYVANLIGLSMVRELGPLMTAIVLAGRSGSAFAAELGTMKVNEEIDAMTTMGLDPVRFLVVPRVIAAVIMTPILTVYADLIGIVGGAVVLLALGYPLVTYTNQILSAVSYGDFLGGLVKSFVFGILIAGVGCLRGLQTGTGASAVGDSTTRAVVSGIIIIVVTDGIFSVVFFYLGV